MKAIKIDVEQKNLIEFDYQTVKDLYEAIDHNYKTDVWKQAFVFEGNDKIFVGTNAENIKPGKFTVDGLEFHGNAVLLGFNSMDNAEPPDLTISELKQRIKFI